MRSARVWKNGLMVCTALAVAIVGAAMTMADAKKQEGRSKAVQRPSLSNSANENVRGERTGNDIKQQKSENQKSTLISSEQVDALWAQLEKAAESDLPAFVEQVQALGINLTVNFKTETLRADIKSRLSELFGRTSNPVQVPVGGGVAGSCATPNVATLDCSGAPDANLVGDTTGAGDDCATRVGVDQVWELTVASAGLYTFRMDITPPGADPCAFDSFIYLDEVCCPVAATSIASDDDCDTIGCFGVSCLGEVTPISLTPGTYYLLIEGFDSAQLGPYNVTVGCSPPPVCGNGVPEMGEQCDDGNMVNTDGCNNMCQEQGACCVQAVGCSCSNQTSAACLLAGGSYRGDASLCGSGLLGNCDCNSNGTCDQSDLLPTGGSNRDYIVDVDPDLAIPDAGATTCPGTACAVGQVCVDTNLLGTANRCGVEHVINVPDSGIISDVNIDIDIAHTWYGDVNMIVSHGGVSVRVLANASPDDSSNLNGLYLLDDEAAGTFDAAAVAAATSDTVITAGSYRPDNLLSAFDGMNKMGDWTIRITDHVGSDTGNLRGWSVHVVNNAGAPVGTDCNDNLILDACEGVNPNAGACCVSGVCSEVVGMGACAGLYFGDCTQCATTLCPDCGNGVVDAGEDCDDGGTSNGDGCSSLCLCEGTTPHDTCATRDTSDTVVPSTYSGNNQCAADDTGTCTVSSPNQALWYQVTGNGETFTLTTCFAGAGTDYDTMVQVWCGDCADLVCIDGNDDQAGAFDTDCDTAGTGFNRGSTLSWCTTVGQTYFIAVGGFSAAEGNHVLSVTADGMACAGALPCTPPVGACCKADGTCLPDLTAGVCATSGGVYQGDDVDCIDVTCPVCGNGTVEGAEECDDMNLMNGDGCSASCTCETGGIPATNDCASATSIGNGSTFINTNGATTDGFAETFCDPNFFGTDNQVHSDIWRTYSATCGVGGIVSVDTIGSTFDSRLAVYLGADCPLDPEDPVACDDDAGGNLTSAVSFPSAGVGQMYKIRVGGFTATDTGCGFINISCVVPVCGNNVVEPGEECDLGDVVPGDGCSATCQNEGACCDGNTCLQISDTACAALTGTYSGDGVACTSQCTFGACCTGTGGACEQVSFKCCAEQGGTFVPGTSCAAANCPCDVVCAPGKIAENEADCGLPSDTLNGGCNSPSGGGTSDCCSANGGLGCDDPTCEAAVCLVDDFCCLTAYDDICADIALTECPVLCPPPSFPFFSPISCGQAYCASGAFDSGLGLRDTDWYKLVLASDTEVTWTVTAEFNSLVGIVDTAGVDACPVASFLASDTGVGCESVSLTACLTAGTWYLFAAADFLGDVACPTEYNATLTCGTCGGGGGLDPQADACADRETVGNGVQSFDLTTATTDGVAEATCAFAVPGTPANQLHNDIWYNYTATCTGNLLIDTCGGGDFDTRISVYSGFTCPTGAPIDCDDDDDDLLNTCGGTLESALSIPVTIGQQFKIRVGEFDAASASGVDELNIQCVVPPVGACCVQSGTCTCSLQSAANCALAGGTYKGDGSTCVAGTCDCNTNGQCDNLDITPSGGTERTYNASPALAIPDSPLPGITHVITVGDAGIIFDVDVDFDATHTWISDMFVTVEHLGTTVVLWDNGCGNFDDMNVIFDDAGAAVACASPTVGTIEPTGATAGVLAAFNGMQKQGDWTISVSDEVGTDTGTLNAWSLHILNNATVVSEDCDDDGIPDECEPKDCNNNGIMDDCDLAGNDNIPPGGDGVPDDCNCINDSDCGGGTCMLCDYVCETGTPCANELSCLLDGPNNACNAVTCAGTCQYDCIRYGDVDPPHNNLVNLDDILCVLSGFSNPANCIDADIAPCGGNGIINLDDILAVLNAFAGANPCDCMAAGVSPLCGSNQP